MTKQTRQTENFDCFEYVKKPLKKPQLPRLTTKRGLEPESKRNHLKKIITKSADKKNLLKRKQTKAEKLNTETLKTFWGHKGRNLSNNHKKNPIPATSRSTSLQKGSPQVKFTVCHGNSIAKLVLPSEPLTVFGYNLLPQMV